MEDRFLSLGAGTQSSALLLLLDREPDRVGGPVRAASRRLGLEVRELRSRMHVAEQRSRSFEHLEKRLAEIGVSPEDPEAFAKANEKLRVDRAASDLADLRGIVTRLSTSLIRAAEGKNGVYL